MAAPYTQYQEVNYKIMLIGKSFSGKTCFIESMCNSKQTDSSSSNALAPSDKSYRETPGISITHLYWPIKMQSYDRFLMFNLSMWDVGKNCSEKYDYILPVCVFIL